MKPILFTLTGPSCAGKSTLEKMLKDRGFVPLVSTTTRAPRVGEEHGKHYYFLTREQVEAERAGFIELTEFNGNLYGMTVAEVERAAATGQPIALVVEPNGLRQIRDYCRAHDWIVVSIFVDNPPEVIYSRFLKRWLDDAVRGDTMKQIDIAAKRITVMSTEERTWRNRQGLYEVTVDRFNAENGEKVADMIALWSQQIKEHGHAKPFSLPLVGLAA